MTDDFLPVFIERLVNNRKIRFGMLPSGRERALGVVGLVPLAESLAIYRAALTRGKWLFQDRVVQMHEFGRLEEFFWDGEKA